MINKKIKKELLANLKYMLSKMKFSKKNIRGRHNINKISNKIINELKKSCKKLYGKKGKKRK